MAEANETCNTYESFYIQFLDIQIPENHELYLKGSLGAKIPNYNELLFISEEFLNTRINPKHLNFKKYFKYFQKLDKDIFVLLLPINDPKKRFEVFQDTSWLDEGLYLKEKEEVRIINLGKENEMRGIIKFGGKIKFHSPGIYFGIELKSAFHGKGTTDGLFKNVRYFSCQEDCGIFPNLSKVRRVLVNQYSENKINKPEEMMLSIRNLKKDETKKEDKAFSNAQDLSTTYSPFVNESNFIFSNKSDAKFSTKSDICPDKLISGIYISTKSDICPDKLISGISDSINQNLLKENDRVIWFSDSGPEKGIVKWIGFLPDAPKFSEIIVGVEFVNPIDSGTKKYKGQTLFKAENGHASLIPISGLVKDDSLITSQQDLSFETQSNIQYSDHIPSVTTLKISSTDKNVDQPSISYDEGYNSHISKYLSKSF